MQRNRQAFTLAEMMVVMLILTVILAAFAPMMTKRKTVDLGTPWRWAANNRDIYFGLAPNQSVMLGQNSKDNNDGNAKLIIRLSDNRDARGIVFKRGNIRLGEIYVPGGNNFLFGSQFADRAAVVDANSASNNTAFGGGALRQNTTGSNNVAVGTNALGNLQEAANRNVAVGSDALLNLANAATQGTNDNIGIGFQAGAALGNPPAEVDFSSDRGRNIAIGTQAFATAASGSENVAIGYQALRSAVTSMRNTAIGFLAMSNTTNPPDNMPGENVAVGERALYAQTTGKFNTAVGSNALRSLLNADNNTAVGHSALSSLTTIDNLINTNNTAVGAGALSGSNLPRDNTAVGVNALSGTAVNFPGAVPAEQRVVQQRNTAVGAGALSANSEGNNNTAIGASALMRNTVADNNTALGVFALTSNTSGVVNTGIGASALRSNTSGSYNVAIGGPTANAMVFQESAGHLYETSALYANTTGSNNVAIGNGALKTNTTGSDNVAIGYKALDGISGLSNNVAVGSNAMITSSHAKNSTAIGYSALKGTKLSGSVIANSQEENTAIGANALKSVTSGAYNTAVGSSTLASNNTGRSNVAFGHKALYSNTTGIGNIAIGGGYNVGTQTTLYGPLHKNTTGFGNIAIGLQALLENTTGRDNIAIGYQALLNNKTDGVIPSNNIAIGKQALKLNTTGSNNLAIGNNACAEIGLGTGITCIGNNSGPKGYSSVGLANSSFHIGTEEVPVYIARRMSSDSTNGKGGKVYIGGTDSEVVIGNSDTRRHFIAVTDKGQDPSVTGSAVILGGRNARVIIAGRTVACNGVFNFDGVTTCAPSVITPTEPPPAVTYTTETQLAYTLSDMRKKNIKSEYKSGLEQIRQMMPKNFVYKDDEHKINRVGLIAQDLEKIMPEAVKKDKDGFLRVSNEHIKYALVNAVKQLDTLVQNIVTQVKELADKILCIDKRVKELEKENKELKQQIDKINKRLEKLENDD